MTRLRMLDLCCGRLGWSTAFLSRGWEVVGVDLVAPPFTPEGFTFHRGDILDWCARDVKRFDFACVSTPCDEFAVWGMKHFHPNPKHPASGLALFNHASRICRESGIPYVMENVRAAQQFIGTAVNHCGPFHLWGNAVPPLLPGGITKSKWSPRAGRPGNWSDAFMGTKSVRKATMATIPPELAGCVADYAQRICLDLSKVPA